MQEVELRCFIEPGQVDGILQSLAQAGYTQTLEQRQVTYYLDVPSDTRVQICDDGSGKVWQKLGAMHSQSRVEHESKMTAAAARTMLTIFKNMDMGYKVMWLRHRRAFAKSATTITVDHTVGYGWIVEVEMTVDAAAQADALAQITAEFANLGLAASPKAQFDEAFQTYMAQWRELTAGQEEDFLNKVLQNT